MRQTLRSSILPGGKRRASGLLLSADGFTLHQDDAAAAATDAGPQPVVQGRRGVPDHNPVKDVQDGRAKLVYKPNHKGEAVGNKVLPLPGAYSPCSDDSVSAFAQDIDESRDVQ